MKERKIYNIILILLAVAFVLSSYKINELKKEQDKKDDKKENTEKYTPAFYKICDDDSCIHLLGSIHFADDKINSLSDVVMDAFNKSDSLAVELDLKNTKISVNDLLANDGESLLDVASEEEINKIKDYLKKHPSYTIEQLSQYKIGYISTLLTTNIYLEAGLNPNGVDAYLTNLAYEKKLKVIPLEKVEDQMALLTDYDNKLYLDSLMSIIDNYDQVVTTVKQLYNAYINADIDNLKQLLSEEDETNDEEYLNKLYYDRNKEMANHVEKFLADNENVFVTVGAAHVLQDGGIVDLLKDKYKVELVK